MLVLGAAAAFPAKTARGASGTWNGTTDALWSSALNWSSGSVPGTGDTATFDNAGNGKTVVDLGAGVTINTILFDTANAAGYTIGAGPVGSQTLTLNNGGAITVNASVVNSQLFNSNIVLGTDGTAQTFTFTNQNTAAGKTLTIAGGITGSAGAGIKTLAIAGAGSTVISGIIGNGATGTVALTKNDAGTLTLSGVNTYTGGTTLNAGKLNVNSAGALGNTATGALTINGGIIDNTSGAAITTSTAKALNWNGDFTFAGTNDLNFNLGAVTLGGATGSRVVTVNAGTLSTGVITGAAGYGLTKTGAGTLAMTSTANTSNIAGTLDIQQGKVQVYGDLTVGGLTGAGTIENGGAASKWLFVNNATDNTFSGTIQGNPANSAVRLGLVKRGTGTLNLTGNNSFTDNFAIENGTVRLTATNTTGSGTSGQASIGSVANQKGVLIIDGGTLNANKTSSPSFSVGTVANAQGFVKISSGTITTTSELWVGSVANAYGALSMSGGTINAGSWLPVGRNGNGIANITGGTINVTAQNYTMGSFAGATGVTNLAGGTVNVTSTGANEGGFIVGEAAAGILNVSGTGALNISGARGLHLAAGAGSGFVNLNGGTVTTPLVQKGAGTGVVNFNGGTLKASASSTTFMQGLTNAFIYAGGATIDTNGKDITIAQPLLAPDGNGLSSIAVASGGAGYIDTPIVTITGGTGTGAQAVANVSGGVVTGFTITNPGTGYSSGDVLTATLIGGGSTTAATVGTITLGANTGGGLTKTGAGVLTLPGTNTYTGPTTVNAGTLLLDFAGSINSSSGILLNGAGAKLVQNGAPLTPLVTVTNGTLDGTGSFDRVTVSDGGSLVNGTSSTGFLTIGTLTFNGTGALSLQTGAGLPASIAANSLFTGATNAAGLVTINVANSNSLWTTGTYNLISYSTLGGQGFASFRKGTISGLGARQAAALTNSPGMVTLTISGDFPVWTGAQNGNWTTNVIGGASNWKLATAGTPTDFIAGDTVVFDDSATGTTDVNISTANVSPTSTTFNNSNRNYTVSSSGGFGIAGGVLIKSGFGSVTLATANTYAGGTTLNDGTLNLNHSSAIGTGVLTINGGTIDNTSNAAVTLSTNNAQSWNGDFQFGGTKDLNLGTGAVTLTANRTVTANGNATLTVGGVISGTSFGITKAGPGNVTLAGANTYTGATNVSGGTLTVTGSINAANAANIGQVSVGNAFDNAVMRIVGGTVNATKTAAPSVIAGNSTSGASGAIFVEGGTLAANNEIWIGDPAGASGGMTVNAGSVSAGSWFAIGRGGSGVLNVNGGTVTVTGQNITVGSFNGANGDVNLTAGTTTTTSTAANQGIFIVGEGGNAVLNMSGSAVLNVSGALGIQTARAAGGSGFVNLNGGTITTPAVTKGAGTTGVFNFNGGTLRPTAANTAFMTGLTAANVFAGGAKIDTNGQNITIAQPLLAPTGSGVTAIAVDNGGTGYIHTPIVRITGGSGTGATGVANITNGVVTGITITNPGTGYQSGDVLFASVIGGATTPASLGAITLAANNTTGGLNKLGAGTLTLSGASTYAGATNVSAGTLLLDATGSLNGSSAININGAGARFVQSNPTTAVTPTVNVTNGTLDGTGVVNTVVVGNGTGGVITNGNGGTGALTIGSLTFTGAGAVNINTAGSVGLAVTGTLTTNAAGTVTLNVPVGIPWATGSTYDLISFGTFNGAINNFVAGSIAGLGARQTLTPVIHNNNVAIMIAGDTPVWTGAASGSWTTTAVGTPFNWKLQIAGTGTEFLANDQVIFDDTATGTTDVTITNGVVTPASVTFNNSAKNYTVSGAGIGSGLLVKNGTGSVTISSANTYTGGTTVNGGALTLSGNNNFGTGTVIVNGGALTLSGVNTYTGATTLSTGGTLNVNNAGALGTGVLTINGGTLANTSGAAVTLTGANAQNWNGDFTFAGTSSLSFNNGAVNIGGAPGQRTVNVASGTLSTGVITAGAGYGLTKTGVGTLAMTSTANTSTIGGLLDVKEGTLQLAGDLTVNGGLSGAGTIENGSAGSKWFYLTNPTDTTFSGTIRDNPNNAAVRLGLVKRGAGTLNLTGANNMTTDRFAIENGAVRITGIYTTGYGTGANQSADIGNVANQTGSLIIDGGTFNANKTNAPSFSVGTVGNAQGVLKITSGVVNAANELWIGSAANGYGALKMSGGTINSGSWLPVGRNGNGIADISGGTINVNTQNFTMGSFGGANGVTNLSGGTINTLSTGANEGGFLVAEGGNATLNVSGTGALNISGSRGLHLATGTGTGIANLNGGTVTTPIVQQGGGTGIMNFNGGTLKASADNASFMQGLTAAYVNSGGAVIDDGGFNITVGQSLLAPTDKGVSSVTVPATSGYAAAPIVQISGDGFGATAVANVDANGNLTGVTITNPGVGYTFATATLIGGNGSTIISDAVNVAANTSGGFTKKGAGTLTLSGANTYTGATVVEAGTLALAVTGSISGSTTIQAKAGATFDVSAFNGSFGLANGQMLKGSGTIAGSLGMGEGSKLSPGDTIGTLTFSGILDIIAGITPVGSHALVFDLAGPGASDKVAFASGGLSIGTGVLGFDDFAFNTSAGLASGTYTLFDGNSAINGTLNTANLSGTLAPGFTGTLALADNGNDLVLTVVPEPGSAALMFAGVGSLLGLRRFRRRSI